MNEKRCVLTSHALIGRVDRVCQEVCLLGEVDRTGCQDVLEGRKCSVLIPSRLVYSLINSSRQVTVDYLL